MKRQPWSLIQSFTSLEKLNYKVRWAETFLFTVLFHRKNLLSTLCWPSKNLKLLCYITGNQGSAFILCRCKCRTVSWYFRAVWYVHGGSLLLQTVRGQPWGECMRMVSECLCVQGAARKAISGISWDPSCVPEVTAQLWKQLERLAVLYTAALDW